MTHRRIAIAGLQHETNTFVPIRTGFKEFRMADSWPRMLQGAEVIAETWGMNLPVAGAITHVREVGEIEPVPILWCAAEPGGPVTDDAFDRICEMILDGLESAGPIDGIYLDLHGAMVTETHFDGEGALLARIRRQVGPDLPVAVSLDLHANLSAELVDHSDAITIYRTYPHLDMAETGGRAMRELLRRIDGIARRAAFRQAPFLVPLHAQFTGDGPCGRLYRLLGRLPSGPEEHVELAMGFTAADIPDCGPSVVAYAETERRAAELADRIMSELRRSEPEFDASLLEPRDAVRRAMALEGTVVIADVQDNPGAGGTSDTTGLLTTLVEEEADNALLGVMCDPATATRAHGTGAGATFRGSLGGRFGPEGQKPFEGKFRVLGLSDGRIAYSGEMYGGGMAEVGPSCLLAVEDIPGDIRIVVSSVRTQCLDRAFFTHFSVDPADAKIVCVKSTVHFRADFEPISSAILNVAAPGLFPCRLADVNYVNTRMAVPAVS